MIKTGLEVAWWSYQQLSVRFQFAHIAAYYRAEYRRQFGITLSP